MKRLLWLAFFAYVAWYGWQHADALRPGAKLVAVVENASGHPMGRVRLTLGSETQVREALANGEQALLTFHAPRPGEFRLRWQWSDGPGEPEWRGGVAAAGGEPLRHHFQVSSATQVFWSSEKLEPSSK